MKIKVILSVMICCFVLTSCSGRARREAYCFGIVFDRNSGNSQITLYCKTADGDNSEKADNKVFILSGKNFREAHKKLSAQSYEIRFNSTEAYFLSENLTRTDIVEISSLILNGTEYRIDNALYIQKPREKSTELYKRAEGVCSDEGIDKKQAKEFLPVIKALREEIQNDERRDGR